MEKQQNDQPEQAASVLHRKTSAGKADQQARAMGLPKALRVSVAKVADDLCEMAMAVIGVRRQTCMVTDLPDLFDAQSLLLLLDGTLQRRAAAMFDQTFVGGLIQQQTMGKVMPPPKDTSRRLTATDAAICAPFLDAVLSRAAKLPEDEAQRHLIEGYRFGAHSEEPRLLMMALDRPEYEIFHLTVDMAGGARQGLITLCFPISAPEVNTVLGAKGKQRAEDGTPQPSQMERTVMALNIELNVALARVRMPLSDLQGLGVGDVLDLEVSNFDQSIVQTRDGRRLSRGKLGQIDGVRALQLEHAPTHLTVPRRRVADRAELDLPRVSGDGTGTQIPPADEMKQLPMAILDTVPTENDIAAMAEVPEMPEMMEVSDLPDIAGLSALGDLPDMSDLPDFEEDNDAPTMTIT